MKIQWMTLMVWMAGAMAQAGQPQEKVAVYMRHSTYASNEIKYPARVMAGQMFARIGISLEWAKAETPSDSTQQAPIIIELVTDMPEQFKPGVLAYALPYEGAHITVLYERIEIKTDPAVLLAHVMVHEITHILEGIDRHSDEGIMKAHWNAKDYFEMRKGALPFAEEDVELIHLGMAWRARTSALTARR
jgi:hypothetical protein